MKQKNISLHLKTIKMITNLETSNGASPSKSNNMIWILLGVAVAGYLAYRYVIKPEQEKRKQEQNQ